ncbi:MAG: serine/threonine-protein kinase, partial [Kofleriaceae bacterium]
MSVIVTPSLPTSEGVDASSNGEKMQGAPIQYRLGRRLGAGGMAEVHLCTVEGPEGFLREVAVKVVREAFAEDARFCELFNAEARLAARLNHPNIVSVTEYNRDAKGRPFLAMEYVDGVDLSRLMYGARPLPFSVVAYLAVEILRGLGYAHAPPREAGIRGLVHRDISPQNVLLSWEGAVKVSDFGIAKALTSSGVMSGSHMGKPAYMSPEQVNGDRVDHRSDLYAVGVMLWEMLTGRQLFERGTAREIFARIVLGNPLHPSQVRTEVPADLEHVAMTLLQREPVQRYARAEDAIADLIKCSSMPRHGPGELITLLAERFHRRARGANDEPVVIEQATADLAQPTASIQTLTEEGLAMDAPLIPSALRPTAATPTPQLEPAPSGRAFAGVALEPVGFLGSTKRR